MTRPWVDWQQAVPAGWRYSRFRGITFAVHPWTGFLLPSYLLARLGACKE